MTQQTDIEWCQNEDGTRGKTWNPIRGCSRVSEGCRHCYAERAAARFSGPPVLSGQGASRRQPYEGLAKMADGQPHWTGKIAVVEKLIEEPLRWRKKGLRVFVNSMSDLFHEGVPDAALDRIFAVMALTAHITYQVLTKRPERMRGYLSAWAQLNDGRYSTVTDALKDRWDAARRLLYAHFAVKRDARMMEQAGIRLAYIRWPLPNVWLGVSAEDQATADARIPELLATPAAVRFVSAEPLLGAIDFGHIPFREGDSRHKRDALTGEALMWGELGGYLGAERAFQENGSAVVRIQEPKIAKLDWVIVGGESGPGARPMHPDWARGIRDQCVAAGVPFFFKQWGEWLPFGQARTDEQEIDFSKAELRDFEHCTFARLGKKRAGRLLDGREWNEMPAGVR